MTEVWTPQRAANRLAKLAEVFSAAHGVDRFPVDVPSLAMETARIFGWSDPITQVQAANIKGFDGALFPGDGRKEWLLLYNEAVSSPGRVRFTQAHELGHYILHRQARESFQCSDADMLNWSKDDKDIEGQADLFASYLLMPLDDYRKQVTTTVDLDLLGHCADRYGVSLTAAILKWLQYTDEKAVLVMSKDGFMDWAWSSEPAGKAGAFFRTRNNVIPVPDHSLAANAEIKDDRAGIQIPASIWFPHASADAPLREMKIHAEHVWRCFDSAAPAALRKCLATLGRRGIAANGSRLTEAATQDGFNLSPFAVRRRVRFQCRHGSCNRRRAIFHWYVGLRRKVHRPLTTVLLARDEEVVGLDHVQQSQVTVGFDSVR